VIAEHELGWGGMRFYQEENALSEARDSILDGVEMYRESQNSFWISLENFVEKSQRHFFSDSIGKGIEIKDSRLIFLGHKFSLAFQIFQSKGARVLFRMAIHYFRRRIGLKANMK
jgi:hypothetical protein